MVAIQRTLYLLGLLAWAADAILYPPWSGRLYAPEVTQPETFSQRGTFGLQGPMRAPLWDPPKPSSDAIQATVRWPWQPVSERAHVEPSLGGIASRLSVGVLVLGLLLWAWTWVTDQSGPDVVVLFAGSLSLSLVLTWVGLLVIAPFTLGLALTGGVAVTILGLGMFGGCLYGAFALALGRFIAGCPAARDFPQREAAARATLYRKALSELAWFTAGIVSACCLTLAFVGISILFRGPSFRTELGMSQYVRNQTPVNVLVGLGILAAGWALGLWMLRLRSPWELPVGLILGTTLSGVVFVVGG